MITRKTESTHVTTATVVYPDRFAWPQLVSIRELVGGFPLRVLPLHAPVRQVKLLQYKYLKIAFNQKHIDIE